MVTPSERSRAGQQGGASERNKTLKTESLKATVFVHLRLQIPPTSRGRFTHSITRRENLLLLDRHICIRTVFLVFFLVLRNFIFYVDRFYIFRKRWVSWYLFQQKLDAIYRMSLYSVTQSMRLWVFIEVLCARKVLELLTHRFQLAAALEEE